MENVYLCKVIENNDNNQLPNCIEMIKKWIKTIVSAFFRFLCWTGVIKPSKVVLMDGGICSQILQYYIGVALYPDYNAEYDLIFWENGGKDGLGNENRPFELLTVFPELPFVKCDRRKAMFYRRYMQTKTPSPPPIYVNNYRYGCDLNGLHDLFNKKSAVLPDYKIHFLKEMQEKHSCGIHFRRGDLANNDNPYYGVFSEEYLIRAMDYVKGIDDKVEFYAFSDDPDWVKTCFMKKCRYPITIIEGNSGSEDLIILANCKYIVASQGTAGRLAAIISGDSLLIMKEGDPHNKRFLMAYKNCVVL